MSGILNGVPEPASRVVLLQYSTAAGKSYLSLVGQIGCTPLFAIHH